MAFIGKHVWLTTASITVIVCALFAVAFYPRGVDFEKRLAHAADRDRAYDTIAVGIDAQWEEDFADARAQYDAAFDIDPTMYRLRFLMGTLDIQEDRLDDALKHLDAACTIDAQPTDALNSRGVVKWRQGDLRGAERDFGRAIDLDPNWVRPRVNRASVRLARGDYRGAMADYQAAVELDTSDPRPHIGIGIIDAIQGDTQQAEKEFSGVIENSRIQSDILAALYNRARLREARGDSEGAEQDRAEYNLVKDLPEDAARFANPDKKQTTEQKGKTNNGL